MTRKTSNFGSTKAVAASGTCIFTGAEIPSDGLLALHISMSGTGGVLGGTGLLRVRVKRGSEYIIDIAAQYLGAFLQRFSSGKVTITQGTTTRFTIPLNLIDAPTNAQADVCQYPPGENFTLELVFGAAGAAVVEVNYTYTDDVPALFYPRLYGTVVPVAGTTTQGVWPISEDGEIRGLGLVLAGLDRLQLVLGREIVQDISNVQGGFLESQWLDNGGATTNPAWLRVDAGRNAPSGSSSIKAGMTSYGAGNEYNLWAIVPLKGAA
jgi:hypothetical protein